MPLHIALLEARSAEITGAVARRCAAVDASLHLVGPLGFATDDPAFRSAGPAAWDAFDWWHHPGWRDFRDAMSRERCLYFAADAERDPVEAPFKPNSVLVFGDESLGLPDRIRSKYPDRVFALPRAARRKEDDFAGAIEATLAFAAKRTARGDAPRERPQRRSRRPR